MFIVYGYDHPKSPGVYYFSGIFKRREDAQKYFDGIPENAKEKNWIEEISQQDYPLYLIEEDFKKSPAKPISRLDLAIKMAMMAKVSNDDFVYFNYYRFLDDYRGFKAGEDNLGMTDHHHVDNEKIYWMIDGQLEEEENNRRNFERKPKLKN